MRLQDQKVHGDSKPLNVSLALLVRNFASPERGAYALRYVAASPEHAHHVFGQSLYRDMKAVRSLVTLCAFALSYDQ